MTVPGVILNNSITARAEDNENKKLIITWDKPVAPHGPIAFYHLIVHVNGKLLANHSENDTTSLVSIHEACKTEIEVRIEVQAIAKNNKGRLLYGETSATKQYIYLKCNG